MPENLTPDRVLAVLKEAAGRPLKAKDISRLLDLRPDDRSDIRAVLRDLVDDGKAVQLESRRFVHASAPVKGAGIAGVVQRKASGVGWFVPDDKRNKDGFLPPQELKSVVDGDRVLARLEKGHKGAVAVIVEVLEHRRETVTGTLRTSNDRRGRNAWLEVDDNVLTGPVRIQDDSAAQHHRKGDLAKDGDVVEVRIVVYPTVENPAEGVIVRRIGEKGALDVEIERLIVGAGVIRAFPPAAVLQAEQHGEDPGEADIKGRLDLRDLPIVTIDGETAKDFDDAVYAAPSKKKKGSLDVIVCVADVSHYVTLGSPLDDEARRRATSIYYPGRVVPMLPEALSNGLCSLKPRVPRLCAVAEFVVDENGAVSDEHFSFGVMKSRARLTYSLVQRFLDEEEGKAEPYTVPPQPKEATATTAGLDDEVKDSLRCAAEAARRLRAARTRRGALDFELPEVVIELDVRKEPVGLRHLDRAFSHKLIEDLMIAANEAAARFFDNNERPSVYRIHEVPDDEKLERFLNLARPALLATGRKLPKNLLEDATSSTGLMELLRALGDHPARAALDMLLLRSMKQARYSVDNVGHYGLGSEAYLHFTSPIRRYPDLIVHRLMRAALEQKKAKKQKKSKKHDDDEHGGDDHNDAEVAELEDIAAGSSEQERKASDLERAISQLHACWLMRERIGEVHPAVVTGVSEAGAFVRLEDLFVEGLVRMQDLGSEYFAYDEDLLSLRGERSKDVITFGVRFDVEVLAVDLQRRQIGFLRAGPLVKPSHPGDPPAPKNAHLPEAREGRNVVRNDVRPEVRSEVRGAERNSGARGKSTGGNDAGWSPRTDARPSVPPQGRGQGPKKKGNQRDESRKERRQEHVDAHTKSVDEKRSRGQVDPLPDPHGRGRGEKQRWLAYETARAHVEDGTATPEERIYVEERQAMLSANADERYATERDRKQKQKTAQQKYDEQQQTSKKKPAPKPTPKETAEPAPAPPAKIRGPDDLRALFESRGGAIAQAKKKPAKKKPKPK